MTTDRPAATPTRVRELLEHLRRLATPLRDDWTLPDTDADPQGLYGKDGPLLVPYDDETDVGMDAATTAVHAAQVAGLTLDALLVVAVLHAPVHRVVVRGELVVADACLDCLGGLVLPDGLTVDEARPCGCAGHAALTCVSCMVGSSQIWPAPWPCATWDELAGVLDRAYPQQADTPGELEPAKGA